MPDVFEYDVFLSFASSDEEIVKPIWQELSQSGLRVFWSPSTLKQEVGNSWFDLIQSSLEKSQHLVLVCSRAAMASEWVRREYSAFFSHCYKPRIRRLVPLLVEGYKLSDLPIFIQDLEALQLGQATSVPDLISVLGGVDVEKLRSENEFLKQYVEFLSKENSSLEEEIRRLSEERSEAPQTIDKGNSQHENSEAFTLLGLSEQATSSEIAGRYQVLKAEYGGLITDSPKRLREACELRLQMLEKAFTEVFTERKREEDQEREEAFEILQLQPGAGASEVRRKFSELRMVCLKALESSDTFIREAATKELQRLREALLLLVPISPSLATTESITEVVIPQMGESITEGTITKWLKKKGERVDKGEPLFEISTDKVDAEIPSPAAGILARKLAVEREILPVNFVVALISSD